MRTAVHFSIVLEGVVHAFAILKLLISASFLGNYLFHELRIEFSALLGVSFVQGLRKWRENM